MRINLNKQLLVIFSIAFTTALTIDVKDAQAQTLQFSSVKIVSSVETVPSGKVWKLEAALGPAIMSNCSTAPMHTLKINGSDVNVGTSGNISFNSYCYGWSGIGIVTDFPIWLPANATLQAGSNVTGISVLEFDIVP
ncbi:MAG: hypothetical protein IT223_10235 [Crocinitomicaceae bacterium]|nr:hypothetical protein [Crocinitomicaceae bacterium]